MKYLSLAPLTICSLFLVTACGGGSSDSSPVAFSLNAEANSVGERETFIIDYQFDQLVDANVTITADKGTIDTVNKQIIWSAYEVDNDTFETITVTANNGTDSYSQTFHLSVIDTDYVFYFTDPDVPNQDFWDDRNYAAPRVNSAYIDGLIAEETPINIAMSEIGYFPHPDLPELAGTYPAQDVEHFHGNLVGSLMVALQNNGEGVAGLVSNAQLYRIDYTQPGWAQYLIDQNAMVLNISYGGVQCSRNDRLWLQDEIDTYVNAGGIITVSTGNDASATFQGCQNIILVASVDIDGSPSGFSNYGNSVDISGFGGNQLLADENQSYRYAHGTSYSTPSVASAVAFGKQKYPQLTHEVAELGLTQSAKPFPVKLPAGGFGAGILDAYAFIEWLDLYYGND
ncbi:hypothetical protein DU002_18310 [Corallincola holothuriorum]|uniref:Peptidase S8/S53 domain-containing protein n=1 Tax=Corallincola holothuriorum TaxID=2282215 RepID=A0A368N2I5_9GAMM|nr:S8 family serine peptidase [Corallincola holothuriorum]RCU43834.1 hypothetical protein DU002_18310 [Corallincola holothuriorum]